MSWLLWRVLIIRRGLDYQESFCFPSLSLPSLKRKVKCICCYSQLKSCWCWKWCRYVLRWLQKYHLIHDLQLEAKPHRSFEYSRVIGPSVRWRHFRWEDSISTFKTFDRAIKWYSIIISDTNDEIFSGSFLSPMKTWFSDTKRLQSSDLEIKTHKNTVWKDKSHLQSNGSDQIDSCYRSRPSGKSSSRKRATCSGVSRFWVLKKISTSSNLRPIPLNTFNRSICWLFRCRGPSL